MHGIGDIYFVAVSMSDFWLISNHVKNEVTDTILTVKIKNNNQQISCYIGVTVIISMDDIPSPVHSSNLFTPYQMSITTNFVDTVPCEYRLWLRIMTTLSNECLSHLFGTFNDVLNVLSQFYVVVRLTHWSTFSTYTVLDTKLVSQLDILSTIQTEHTGISIWLLLSTTRKYVSHGCHNWGVPVPEDT